MTDLRDPKSQRRGVLGHSLDFLPASIGERSSGILSFRLGLAVLYQIDLQDSSSREASPPRRSVMARRGAL
jgi:hypothetical protein